MKTAAIICEFNPLHYGHKKLIDYAKTFSDKVICIMSGNFTQRGMPACADKYSRAIHAIKAGADLVVELPVAFATASAENFAFGGVTIANVLHADYLLFGSECGNLDELCRCAQMLNDEQINLHIAAEMSRGVSYPKAVSLATQSDVVNYPNNVLAIEYLRALKKTNSNVKPVTIKRENNYNGEPLVYASSGYLRKNPDTRDKYAFDFVIRDIDDTIEARYCDFATHRLSLYEKEQLEQLEGVTEGLENRIFNAGKSRGYETMIEEIKTKRYTRMKLQRIILNATLSITKNDILTNMTTPKIKVLAVNSQSTALLNDIENVSDELTKRADRLYYTFTEKKPPQKLVKIQL